MNRLEKIRQVVDAVLARQEDVEERRCGYVHLYGVSTLSTLLAMKRGLDPELASVAGMLHDIYSYRTKLTQYHAHNSEEDARVILRDSGLFTEEEQRLIRSAIFHHSDKMQVHQPYDELLKDADVVQHYLYNPTMFSNAKTLERLKSGLGDLDIHLNLEKEDFIIKKATEKATENTDETVIEIAVNAQTRNGLAKPLQNRRAMLADIAEQLASIPLRGNEKQSGPDVYPLIRYFPGTDLENGFDWCASFVYHCCMEAGFVLPIKYPEPVPCRFAGVLAWLVWAQLPEIGFYYAADAVDFQPRRGDIVIFDNIVPNGPHDHIGIVLRCENGVLTTAEGNVCNASGIFQRDRFEHVNGFIRIDNAYEYN